MAPVPVTTTRVPFTISRSPFHTGARFCDPSTTPAKTGGRPARATAAGEQERRHAVLQLACLDRVVQRGQRRGCPQRSVAHWVEEHAARRDPGLPTPALHDLGRRLLADYQVDLRD